MPSRKGIKNEIPYGTLVGVSPEIRSLWYSKHDEPAPCELLDAPVVDDDRELVERDCKVLADYLMDALSPYDFRTKQILRMRYWSDMTYNEIGDALGISGPRIQQLEKVALRKFRAWLHRIRDKI